jgi:hypothetical protein
MKEAAAQLFVTLPERKCDPGRKPAPFLVLLTESIILIYY